MRIALGNQTVLPIGVSHLQGALLKEHGILLPVYRLPGRCHQRHRPDEQPRILVLRFLEKRRVLLFFPNFAEENSGSVHNVLFFFTEQTEGFARVFVRQDVQQFLIRFPAEQFVHQAVEEQAVGKQQFNGFFRLIIHRLFSFV